MLHRINTEWPCLSCDFLLSSDITYQPKKTFYKKIEKYPLEVFLIAGTQSTESQNYLYLMKWENLRKTKYDDDSDYEDSDENNEDENNDPQLNIQ